ncbi:tyrosine-type recombinase/integrase [Lysinibacillus endophyticus]|uniref:tyrosine-type recombinase/integrase n=1 Tax=Ureibacillus endophyticus TaxID=1978490 RepID=UPI0020A1B627|nr:tyrosine-type recombinase/integrase [Lysinibacillus endophyticus]MCP1143658.1 tyrosine-type recombinase/integrase [Lysinibacillus endophyticus]
MTENILESFRQWLIEDGRAIATIDSYMNDIRKFNDYLVEKDCDPEVLLSRFYFTSYMKHLEVEGMAVSTRNKKVNSLKVYNDYLFKSRFVDDIFISIKRDKVKIAHGSEGEVSVLTDAQVEQFLFHLEKETQRNKLIGYLLLYTGIRVTELVDIKICDVDQLTSHLTVRGKGGKIREIPLRKDVLEAIQVYMRGERGNSKFPKSPFLLVSQRAEKMHRDAVRRLLEITGKQLGFHIHPHMLRHTFCTRLIRNGVEISTVSKLAGHAGINMTVKYYINTSKEEKQNAVDLL